MARTIISIVIMIFAAWVGLVASSIVSSSDSEVLIILFPLIAGVACIVHAIEANKKEK